MQKFNTDLFSCAFQYVNTGSFEYHSQYLFQQASLGYHYPPAMQYSQTMQSLPPSGPLPPQSNWLNTVPARGRGRGKFRPEELETVATSSVFRPVTPEQYSAPSSRSHTPSQECVNRYAKSFIYFYVYLVFSSDLYKENYVGTLRILCDSNRSYDRRDSNSTYTSMESLSRADSVMIPPPLPLSTSPATSQSNSNKGYKSPEIHRRGGAISPIASQHRTCNT